MVAGQKLPRAATEDEPAVAPHERLEQRIAEWMGYRPEQVVCCASGTAALHLALEALQLPPGSQVIMPDLTMVACARACKLAGVEPVLVDCHDHLLMDLRDVARKTGYHGVNAGAIMVVHLYGRRQDMDALRCASAVTAPLVIEDLAEAHGVRPHPQTDAACWSFYKNKIVAGYEGGAVAFKNPAHASLARSLRSLGFTDAHDFQHIPRGHNYRMSDPHAEAILTNWNTPVPPPLGRNGKPMIELVHELRRRIEGWYDEHCPAEWKMPPRDVVWVYDVRIPGMTDEMQTVAVRVLQAQGIAARHCFKPMRMLPEFNDRARYGDPGANALAASREVIYLPCNPEWVNRYDCKRAFDVLRRVLGA